MIKSSFAVFAFFERFLLRWTNFVQNLISLSPPEIDHTPASTAVRICLLIGCMWACASACNLVDYNCGDDLQFVLVSIFITWFYFLWPKARVLPHKPSTGFNTWHELHDVLRLKLAAVWCAFCMCAYSFIIVFVRFNMVYGTKLSTCFNTVVLVLMKSRWPRNVLKHYNIWDLWLKSLSDFFCHYSLLQEYI